MVGFFDAGADMVGFMHFQRSPRYVDLEALTELREEGLKAPITVGITPILAEQLDDADLKQGFVDYLQTRLKAVRDAHMLGPSTGATIAAEEAAPARIRAAAEDACRPLRRKGLPYRVTVRRGEPAPTIEGIAAAGQADLLVLGSSGEGLDGDPIAGSVSRMVAHHAGRPVVVVPGPGAGRGAVAGSPGRQAARA